MPTPVDPAIRFWTHVDKSGDCWIWTGARYALGYGAFGPKGTGAMLAHRYSWMMAHGEIPAGMLVLHKCDVRCCVNPDHLFLGTQKDNIADMIAKGRRRGHNSGPPVEIVNPPRVIKPRMKVGASVCALGHQMTPENTHRPSAKHPNRRECKTCRNARRRRLMACRRQHQQTPETTTASA